MHGCTRIVTFDSHNFRVGSRLDLLLAACQSLVCFGTSSGLLDYGAPSGAATERTHAWLVKIFSGFPGMNSTKPITR